MAAVFRHPSLRIKGAPWPPFSIRLAYAIVTPVVLGSNLFISTHGASGDTHSRANDADEYTHGGSGDTYTKAGMGES